ncbi:unnamed protein product [Colletotrichum noveboracense]|uniref:Uncharacterized protein n=1 Tax=Colletotrichum noveboracense TaxID=2664923 RepID=A0A9W4RX93_9PEZI|nr:unnamed protein product [Colletotrichum noveboracense]
MWPSSSTGLCTLCRVHLQQIFAPRFMTINNGQTHAPGFDIASGLVQFVWTFSFPELAASRRDFRTPTPSLSPRRRRSATKFVWVGSGARSSDLPEHAVRVFPSLQVLNRVSSQFPHETFEHPRHRYPVRSILGGGCVCHLPHRTMAPMRDSRYPFAGRSIVSLPAATADDAEDDVSEISWKTPIFGASNIFATH